MVPRPDEESGQAHILLVEDDVLVRFVVADRLRDAGLAVIEAATADEALSYLVTGGRVDLAFTDIEIPGSMNGLELANKLKSAEPDLPLILTSGKFMSQNIGALGLFLSKPFAIDRAVALVFEALGVQQPDGGA
jgi:two-component system, response regulator PdtaR